MERTHRYAREIFDPEEAIRAAKEMHKARLEWLREPPVTQEEFAGLIQVHRRTVQDYIGRGILHADKNGHMNVTHNMRRYCAYLRDEDLSNVD